MKKEVQNKAASNYSSPSDFNTKKRSFLLFVHSSYVVNMYDCFLFVFVVEKKSGDWDLFSEYSGRRSLVRTKKSNDGKKIIRIPLMIEIVERSHLNVTGTIVQKNDNMRKMWFFIFVDDRISKCSEFITFPSRDKATRHCFNDSA